MNITSINDEMTSSIFHIRCVVNNTIFLRFFKWLLDSFIFAIIIR